MEHLTRQAKGEVNVRIVGRIDKRVRARRAAPRIVAAAAVIPWYQRNTRPLSIGASVGHVDVTAGTIGAFVRQATTTVSQVSAMAFARVTTEATVPALIPRLQAVSR